MEVSVYKIKLVKLNPSLGTQGLSFLTNYLVIISNDDLKCRPTSVCQMSQTSRFYSALQHQRSLQFFSYEKRSFMSELTANANLSETFDQKRQICWLRVHSFISIQPQRPGWQEPEPRHVTGMALAHCILGTFLGVVCHCFPPPLDVPTFATRCLYARNDARDPSSERRNSGREIVG